MLFQLLIRLILILIAVYIVYKWFFAESETKKIDKEVKLEEKKTHLEDLEHENEVTKESIGVQKEINKGEREKETLDKNLNSLE